MSIDSFIQEISDGYDFEHASILLGAAMYEGQPLKEKFIRIPLATLNRHGLIAGATGTGKTKTLQILAEQLSAHGVASLVMDIKGDLSGIAVPNVSSPKIEERHQQIGYPYIPGKSPVEFLTLSDGPGVRLRSTVIEFGPVLFSRMLDLSEAQQSVIAVIFKYCDDHALPLVDLNDLKKVLQYAGGPGKASFESEYGRIMSSSTGAILRKIIELEQQGADLFFGEPSFDVFDLVRTDSDGHGIIHILRLVDLQDRPKLFSTFMLQLLAEIYAVFPEEGDLTKPKLTIFIDEAHLLFENASKALLDQIEVIVKLIRSKGVGIFFVTQNPVEIPDKVLSQLGLKIQHALRAFTARDRKSIVLASENFPFTDHYKTDQLITQMGIGEAMITALDEKGIPTPLVHTLLRAPQSRMDVLQPGEIDQIVRQSNLRSKYLDTFDNETAYEILSAKMEDASASDPPGRMSQPQARKRNEKSTFEKVLDSPVTRQAGRTVARELTRGILGVLGVKTTGRRSSRRSTGWF